MAVNWYWKDKVGEIHYYDVENKQHWHLDMYTGNMMCCLIHNYKKKNEETGKIEKFYNFFIWFNDIEHLKRALKEDKHLFDTMAMGTHKLRKFRLCITNKKLTYSNQEMIKFAKIVSSLGYKVEVY